MSYELHITRTGGRMGAERRLIPFDEWRAAVEATPGVRLFTGDSHRTTNPKTGQLIAIRANPGDAEVLFPSPGPPSWRFVFRWSYGRVGFRLRADRPGTPDDPVWMAAVALATRLGAAIEGDEGEVHDLRTGEARPQRPERCCPMSKPKKKFDAVAMMRSARDRISAKIDAMTLEEELAWLASQKLDDPFLERLRERAARPRASKASGAAAREGG